MDAHNEGKQQLDSILISVINTSLQLLEKFWNWERHSDTMEHWHLWHACFQCMKDINQTEHILSPLCSKMSGNESRVCKAGQLTIYPHFTFADSSSKIILFGSESAGQWHWWYCCICTSWREVQTQVKGGRIY